MPPAVYTVVTLAALAAGVAVHEGTHYAACRLVGAPARPTYRWGAALPAPAIYTPIRAHTPATYRLVTLAPLAVFVPSVVVGGATGLLSVPAHTVPQAAWLMWCLGTFPSPSDLQQASTADSVADLHGVWYGSHPTHTAAEGVSRA